ncbi:MAG: hypothetical protein KGL11_01965 [Alphaproteobacteria bacterium]|nr:hypothetical protein [Alphaproteobacteria bacterium]
MDGLSGDAGTLYVFFYLLPGFIGLQFYGYLAVGAPADALQKIVIALSLTAVSALVVTGLAGAAIIPPPPPLPEHAPLDAVIREFIGTRLFYLCLASITVATVFAVLNNHGVLYRSARWLRLTRRSGRASVWQDIFNGNTRAWVRVHLKDGRIVRGWPQFASDDASVRELYLREVVWWVPSRGRYTRHDGGASGVYLGNFDDIASIEVFDQP